MSTRERTAPAVLPGRGVALAAAVLFVALGGWAFLAPRSFFDAVATFDPFSAHFLRDVGAFQIGLGAVLLVATRARDALIVALVGTGVGAAAHALGHLLDQGLGGRPAIDVPALTLLAVVLLWAGVARARAARDG